MGSNCPSQKAQPFGAKLNGKMRISATNGSAIIFLLGRGREDSEERDDEIHTEVRLKVIMRLAAASGRYGGGVQRRGSRSGRKIHDLGDCCRENRILARRLGGRVAR